MLQRLSVQPASDAVDLQAHAGVCASGSAIQLSNDYLNHYSEALMLIEMVADCPEVLEDLAHWTPKSYCAYFEASPLRHAPESRAAYDHLTPDQKEAFEDLTRAMDRLVLASIHALRNENAQSAAVAEIVGAALHPIIARATYFLNSGGASWQQGGFDDVQPHIDLIMGAGANS